MEGSSLLIQEIRARGIPEFWKDTSKMQKSYTLEVKGWTKQMEWKNSSVPEAGTVL